MVNGEEVEIDLMHGCPMTLADITVDAGDIVRSVADQLELPEYPDDWVQETTSEQDADLGKMVAKTVREWIKKHNLKLTEELIGQEDDTVYLSLDQFEELKSKPDLIQSLRDSAREYGT
jgi:hypothetical protein